MAPWWRSPGIDVSELSPCAWMRFRRFIGVGGLRGPRGHGNERVEPLRQIQSSDFGSALNERPHKACFAVTFSGGLPVAVLGVAEDQELSASACLLIIPSGTFLSPGYDPSGRTVSMARLGVVKISSVALEYELAGRVVTAYVHQGRPVLIARVPRCEVKADTPDRAACLRR